MFELLEAVVTAIPPAVTADNYESIVLMLNSFAAAGSVGAMADQQKERDRQVRRAKPAKQMKPRYVIIKEV